MSGPPATVDPTIAEAVAALADRGAWRGRGGPGRWAHALGGRRSAAGRHRGASPGRGHRVRPGRAHRHRRAPGRRVGELDAVLAAAGQQCPLDPRSPDATVGGVLATGLSGPPPASPRPGAQPPPRGAPRPRRRARREGRRTDREERERLRRRPAPGRVVRHPRRARPGHAALRAARGRVDLVHGRRAAGRGAAPRRSGPPRSLVGPDATTVLRRGVPRGRGDRGRPARRGAGRRSAAVAGRAPTGVASRCDPARVDAVVRRARRPGLPALGEAGVGTVHVAAPDAEGARRRPGRSPTPRGAGCSARPGATPTASASRCPNVAVMARIKDALDPAGKLQPGSPPARRPRLAPGRPRDRRVNAAPRPGPDRRSSGSTPRSWSPASAVGCASRTAPPTGSPGSRSRRPEAASPRCGRSTSTARRSTTRSSPRWTSASSAGAARPACPSGGAVRPPDGGTRASLRRRCTCARAAAVRRVRRGGRVVRLPRAARPPPARWSRSRGSCWSAQRLHLVPAAVRRAPDRSRRAAPSARRRRAGHRRRLRAARVRDGRLAARRAPRHPARCCGPRAPPDAARCRGRLLRRAARARRPGRPGPGPGPPGDRVDARATRRSSSNSAGCGAAMKDYGHLLGTPEADAFAARVRRLLRVARRSATRFRCAPPDGTVVVQDPCHLRHVQKAHLPVRDVLGPAYTLRRAGRRRAVLRRRRRVQRAPARRSRARSATARWPRSVRSVGPRPAGRVGQPRLSAAPAGGRARRPPPRRAARRRTGRTP